LLYETEKKGFLRRAGFWLILLLVFAGFAAGWWIYQGLYVKPHRFNYILIRVNQQNQKIFEGETFTLHPRDTVKVLDISTNIPFNREVRLFSEKADVDALRFEEKTLAALLPGRNVLDHYRFNVKVKYRDEPLGSVKWEVKPYVEDWVDKANRTIDEKRRLAILERAVELHPQDRRLRERLLKEYKSLGRWEKAAALLEKMGGEAPGRGTLMELKELYLEMGDPQAVISVLEKLVNLEPDNRELRFELAEKFEETGNLEEAILQYRELLEQGAEKLPIYKRLGYLYTETEQLEKAVSFYLKAVKLDQQDANLHYNLAHLYELLGEPDKAAFYLANAVTLRSDDMESRLELARQLLDRGKVKEAEAYLTQVLKKEPKSPDALRMLAGLLEQQGKRERLKETYEKILSLEPENEVVIFNLGVLEYEAGHLDKSAAYLEQYTGQQPDDVEAHRLLFEIYKEQKDQKGALREARRLVELDPQETAAYVYIFEHYEEQGKYQEVIPVMKKAVNANPEQVDLRDFLVLAYIKTDQEALAAAQMKEILKRRPKAVERWLNYARLEEKRGKTEAALEAYKKVMELSPGHQEAEEAYLRLRLERVQGGSAG